MNDLIRRQDAIDAVLKRDAGCGIDSAEVIKDLPSANQWIPCNERLPENENPVLVTTSIGEVTDAEYWHKEQMWVNGFLKIMEVTAWMPLPQPWKGEEYEQIH